MAEKRKPGALNLPSIHSIGISIWDPIHAVRDHTSAAHELVHVLQGSVTLHLAGRRYLAGAGDTLLIPEKTVHRDEFPLHTEFRVLHIMFFWDRFKTYLPLSANRALGRLAESRKRQVRQMASDIYSVFRQGGPLVRERTGAKLLDLLLHLAYLARPGRERAPDRSEKRKTLVELAKRYIQEHHGRPISLPDIARHLKLSEYHLSHLFSKEAGFTLSAYVTEVRMEKAAQLLADPTVPVSQAAYAVGYGNANYFSKAFRKYYGTPPGSFQARLLRKNRKK